MPASADPEELHPGDECALCHGRLMDHSLALQPGPADAFHLVVHHVGQNYPDGRSVGHHTTSERFAIWEQMIARAGELCRRFGITEPIIQDPPLRERYRVERPVGNSRPNWGRSQLEQILGAFGSDRSDLYTARALPPTPTPAPQPTQTTLYGMRIMIDPALAPDQMVFMTSRGDTITRERTNPDEQGVLTLDSLTAAMARLMDDHALRPARLLVNPRTARALEEAMREHTRRMGAPIRRAAANRYTDDPGSDDPLENLS